MINKISDVMTNGMNPQREHERHSERERDRARDRESGAERVRARE